MPSPGVFAWSTEQHLQGFDGSPLVELSPGTVYYKDCNIYIYYIKTFIFPIILFLIGDFAARSH